MLKLHNAKAHKIAFLGANNTSPPQNRYCVQRLPQELNDSAEWSHDQL